MRRLVPLILLVACAPDGPPPRVEAHRAGAGYWPENSRTAVRGALEAGFDLEIDVVLTSDLVPVLSTAPYLEPARCTEGGEVADPDPWRDVESARLPGILCGGRPDPRFPNAALVDEPPMTFDELLGELLLAPDDLVVHVDLGHESYETAPAEDFAAAILDRWVDADRPQELVVSSDRADVIAAFEGHGRGRGFDLHTSLEWPPVEPGDTWGDVVERDLGRRITNELDYVAMVREAGADGITVQHELADVRALAAARREGLSTRVFVVNDAASLRRWTADRVDALVTDFPGDVPGTGDRP